MHEYLKEIMKDKNLWICEAGRPGAGFSSSKLKNVFYL